jgi:hypothetical protein
MLTGNMNGVKLQLKKVVKPKALDISVRCKDCNCLEEFNPTAAKVNIFLPREFIHLVTKATRNNIDWSRQP